MPKAREHHLHTQRTDRLLEMLREKQHLPEWVIVAGFLKALHMVEALFAVMPPGRIPYPHCSSHDMRKQQLSNVRSFEHIYRHYRPLKKWSELARYLDPTVTAPPGCDLSSDKAFEYWRKSVENHLTHIKDSAAKIAPPNYGAMFT